MSNVVRYLYGVLNIFILSFFHVILVSRNVDGLISVVVYVQMLGVYF